MGARVVRRSLRTVCRKGGVSSGNRAVFPARAAPLAAPVADVGRAPAAALRTPPIVGGASSVAARAAARRVGGIAAVGKLEPQAARDGIGLDEAQLEPLSGAEPLAALLADQILARFLV